MEYKRTMCCNKKCLQYTLTESNTHIENSFKVTSIRTMDTIIKRLRLLYTDPTLAINKRSSGSMIREWRAHNLLWDFHICRSRTSSVDLDCTESFFKRVGYYILSILYF